MCYAQKINFARLGNTTFIQANAESLQDWIQ